MLNLKDVVDGTVFGGEGGRGVTFVECVHDDSRGQAGQIVFRVKVATQLTGKQKDPNRDDDYTILDAEDFADIREWVPTDTGDEKKFKNSVSRLNKTLAFVSGVEVDPEDPDAWMRAVTSDGDINQGILSNVANVYVYKRSKSDGTYPELAFAQDTTLPKKLTLEEFKKQHLAKQQAKAASPF
jgi:hypothetical protein